MDLDQLGLSYNDVIDMTFNSLQRLLLLVQRMEQILNGATYSDQEKYQLLELLSQIETTGSNIGENLQSFSIIMEEFLDQSQA